MLTRVPYPVKPDFRCELRHVRLPEADKTAAAYGTAIKSVGERSELRRASEAQ